MKTRTVLIFSLLVLSEALLAQKPEEVYKKPLKEVLTEME